MKEQNLSKLAVGALCLAAGAMAGTAKGTVHTAAGTPLANVDVCLTSQSLCTVSDASGAFRLDWNSTGIASRGASSIAWSARLAQGSLEMRLPQGIWNVRVLDAAGRQVGMARALSGNAAVPLAGASGRLFASLSGAQGHSVLALSPLGGWSSATSISGMAAGVAARSSESGQDLRLTRDGYTALHATTGDDSASLDLALTAAATRTVFTVGTDYTNNVASLERVTATGTDKQLLTWSTSDVVVAASGSTLFVLNRSDAVITAYAGGQIDESHLLWQTNVGTGTEPYAVLSDASRYWVVLNGANSMAKLGTDGKSSGSIDLSSQKSDSGTVNAAVGAIWNGSLVVGLQRLNGWTPSDTSRVVLIDTATGKVTKSISLPFANPQTISVFEGKAWLACVGSWYAQDGGLVEVDLSQGTTRTVVTEAQVGGDISGFEAAGPMRGYLMVGGAYPVTTVRKVNLAAGTFDSAVAGLSAVGCLHYDGTSMWVGDRASGDKQSLNAVEPRTGAITRSIKPELPPGSIASILP